MAPVRLLPALGRGSEEEHGEGPWLPGPSSEERSSRCRVFPQPNEFALLAVWERGEREYSARLLPLCIITRR